MSATILFALFFLFMLLGTPLGIAIGAATLLVMEFVPGSPPSSLLIKNAIVGSDNFPLVAVPMFILAGEIMLAGGLSSRIVGMAAVLVGRMKAGLAYVNVIASMFFAAISGSSPATVAAIGSNLIPEMEKRGYRRDFSAALTSASGMLGVMIPPSIPLIIYGVVANVSLGALFLAGILPGILFGVGFMVVARVVAPRYMASASIDVSEKLAARQSGGLWALLVPLIILGGIYGGIFTPTEAAGVAVVYALFVSLVVYREIGLSDLPRLLVRSATTTATIMIMVAMAFAFGRFLTIEGIPGTLAGLISGATDSPILILIMLNAVLLVTGMFLEPVAAIIILTPILLPVANSAGVDPVHFGIIVTCNLAIGFCTPPVGINLFIASSIARVPVEAVVARVVPFMLAMAVSMALVTFLPAISLFLPDLAAK